MSAETDRENHPLPLPPMRDIGCLPGGVPDCGGGNLRLLSWENLQAALALYFAWYNFCRVHRTLRVTPAMEAGIAEHVWNIDELLAN